MKLRRIALLCAGLVIFAALPAAHAEAPLKGTVERTWASVGKSGAPQKRFSTASATIYANFVWKRSPTPGQGIAIRWTRPDGHPVYEWKGTTLKGDRPGTRMFAFLTKPQFRTQKGTWKAVLSVGGIPRGTVRFTVVS